ncbi:MAG: peroxiredoxin [Burkholderiales bacterium]
MNFLRVSILGLLMWLTSPVMAAALPEVGSTAPNFSLPDQSGNTHTLTQYRGKWLVLYFYPKDDTPGCTEQACKFRDDFAVLKILGAEVLGVSVDDSASHAEFARKHKLPFPLLADKDGLVANSYGSLRDLMVIKIAKRNTFLINPQGRIEKVFLGVDTARNSAEIIATIRQLTGKK